MSAAAERPAAMWVSALLLAILLGGCAHERFDPVRTEGALGGTGYRAGHPPYGTLAIRHVADRRPSHEVGSINYLNDSWFADRLFEREVSGIVRDVFLLELDESGAFDAVPDAEHSDYVLDLSIAHFTCHVDRDLVGLIPFVPSIDLEAKVTIHVLLRDQDGRRFLDERYEEVEESTTATVAGVESSASDLLLEALERVLRRAVPDADRAVPAFWSGLGLPVLAASGR